MEDAGSDDSNENIASCKAMSAKKRRLSSSSSSNDDTHKTPKKTDSCSHSAGQDASSRSSGRIRQRQTRQFVMPSRHEIWDAIPTTKTPEKSHIDLKPRRLVNNFTRVTHRYNHDPVYTSDEGSSLDGFLAMDDDSSSDSSDSDFCDDTPLEPDHRKKKTKHRVKNRRLIQPSSGSDTDSKLPEERDNEDKDVRKLLRQKLLKKTNSVDGTVDGDTGVTEVGTEAVVVGLKTGVKKSSKVIASSSDEDKSSNREGTSRRSSLRRKKSRNDYSIRDSNKGDNDNDANQAVRKQNKDGRRVPAIPSSHDPNTNSTATDDDEDGSRNDTSDRALEDDSEDSVPRTMRKKRKSLLDSGSDNESGSNNGCGSDRSKARRDRAVGQKDRRNSLFKDFKQARSKYDKKPKHDR
ncbi:nucleolin 2-like isoform X1 [Haliotis rufescens]|uniref:nucleolin 2-like isoform X1 n=1 Tax=Haliotis rufescens TaxID=6454 RepID=UPI001EAFE7CE|nr:nucleolin 2-like isoform X1 [Haliotis rufescens]